MRKFILAGAAVAAMAIASSQAMAADIMTKLTSRQLADLFTSAGIKDVKIEKPEAGAEVVSFDSGNGTMTFALLGCAADGCTTLQMSFFFNKDDQFTLAAVNSYNANYLNAQAALQPDGTVTLMKLFLPGGGVTEANVKLNIAVFLDAQGVFARHITSQVTAALSRPNPMMSSVSPVVQPQTLRLATGAAGSFDLARWVRSQPNQHGASIR